MLKWRKYHKEEELISCVIMKVKEDKSKVLTNGFGSMQITGNLDKLTEGHQWSEIKPWEQK